MPRSRSVHFSGQFPMPRWRIVSKPPFDQDAIPTTERRIKMTKVMATKTTAPRSSGTTHYLRSLEAGPNG